MKSRVNLRVTQSVFVAPLAGAWIEIEMGERCKIARNSRPPRGGVD